jgi:hypothetical protein
MEKDEKLELKSNGNGSGIAQLFFGFLLIFLNVQRGGGFTSGNGSEAFGYNLTGFIIWVISIILVIRGIVKIIKNKKERDFSSNKITTEKESKKLEVVSLEKEVVKTYRFFSIDSVLKIVIGLSVLTVALSVFYYFVARPISRENKLNECLEDKNKQIKKISEKEEVVDGGIAYRIIKRSSLETESIRILEEQKKECFEKYSK